MATVSTNISSLPYTKMHALDVSFDSLFEASKAAGEPFLFETTLKYLHWLSALAWKQTKILNGVVPYLIHRFMTESGIMKRKGTSGGHDWRTGASKARRRGRVAFLAAGKRTFTTHAHILTSLNR
ncbi:hypothetical protein CVT25_011215 [Psilocybe cyanescens]|uniref:Uncharacterized protein n=1 Tax=Psilocybe cyanescens TaxID=93625 RepID=A0A409WH70_PSICY|nr:hypothetical protein CVT25_011215 [Psilocybe cyanescens]